MSEDVKPDVKPDIQKIQLQVKFDGSTVKFAIKRTQTLEKVFNAAAVSFMLHSTSKSYKHSVFQKQFNTELKSMKFIYDGQRVRGEQTPDDLEMEDDDVIDAHLEQLGGGF
ncbi:hypothetical protein SCHPADRAFT_522890 [Schizopora paradoxa]|uniref:Ubiquitin-like domain-containing protein n=1 Tax=Schizopora paradoxa TaxID=27342 RepID=A0A0H2RFN1_9AGAM|nr:hypothetical protein SCHPADRAFT_522890 [Schizopora paradoxa]